MEVACKQKNCCTFVQSPYGSGLSLNSLMSRIAAWTLRDKAVSRKEQGPCILCMSSHVGDMLLEVSFLVLFVNEMNTLVLGRRHGFGNQSNEDTQGLFYAWPPY